MARLQLALNVSNLDKAVEFYSKLFGADVAKRRPGYANFAIADPPLKLVLFENPDAASRLNHLGVEVECPEKVVAVGERLKQADLVVKEQPQTTCCYALQDKVWVSDPDGENWEIYTVLEDSTPSTREDVKAVSVTCCS